MAISTDAYINGYSTHRMDVHCPHCGQRLKRMWDTPANRQLSKCCNADCPNLAANKHDKLIKQIREKIVNQRKEANKNDYNCKH